MRWVSGTGRFSLELANAANDSIKKIALLRLVVVGANFTGVEFAGEFNSFLQHAAKGYPDAQLRHCSITLIEATDRILPALPRGLAEYAAERLDRRGVGIILNNTVERIRSDHVVLKDGRTIATNTVVWCAGIAPNPFIAKIGLPTDERGYILCERDLSVKGYENVWAIGDCAVNPGPDGHPYPATAQHAIREGQHLAKNLARVLKGEETLPCDIKAKGSLAALGHQTGVANIMGFNVAGLGAWLLWRTIYLMKMPGLPRRIRVAMDWILNMLFRRDFVQLGLWEYTSNTGEYKESERSRRSVSSRSE